MKTENLGPMLHARATYKDPDIAMVPRDVYPMGTGLSQSTFTTQPSEPNNDEQDWPIITSVNADGDACSNTWNEVKAGYLERKYGPEEFGMVGPVVCQEELNLHWESRAFWERYFSAMEKHSTRELGNRLRNIQMNFVPHAGTYAPFAFGAPLDFVTQNMSQSATLIVPPKQVCLKDLQAPSNHTYGELTFEYLDMTAVLLNEEGAQEPDTDGWITLGPMGPIYLAELGQEIAHRLLLNNADLRLDLRSGFDTFANANPLLQRMGASYVLKNWRFMVTTRPPRWDFVTEGTDGQQLGPAHLYTDPVSGLVYGAGTNAVNTAYGNPAGCWVRRPVYENVSGAGATAYVTKGSAPIINSYWRDAEFEGFRVLTPSVFTERILPPAGAYPAMPFQAQNYMGDWKFVMGNDAFIGIDGCTVPTGGDPLKEKGRHFARYKHASEPVFPEYGRLIIFRRCDQDIQQYTCD